MATESKLPEREHCLLSPSSSGAWLTCTPSAAMMSLMPKQESVWASNGTDAHALAEHKIRTIILGETLLSCP